MDVDVGAHILPVFGETSEDSCDINIWSARLGSAVGVLKCALTKPLVNKHSERRAGKRAFTILMSRNRCHLVASVVVIVYFMQKKKKIIKKNTCLTAISSSSECFYVSTGGIL